MIKILSYQLFERILHHIHLNQYTDLYEEIIPNENKSIRAGRRLILEDYFSYLSNNFYTNNFNIPVYCNLIFQVFNGTSNYNIL
jgi:hypothetical protein